MAHDDYIEGWAVRGADGVLINAIGKTRRYAIARWHAAHFNLGCLLYGHARAIVTYLREGAK
jgi:hypothetical protein